MTRPHRNSTARAALSIALLSAWLIVLFSGVASGAGVAAAHLLLLAALALFPWRAVRAPSDD